MSGAQPLNFVPTLPAEEAARANCYGLIARLFYAPPDAALIAQLQAAQDSEGEGELAEAWRQMGAAWADASAAALEDEHTALFIGTGKSEVTPYLSHYLLRHANDNPLVELRAQLAAWGIARREHVPEYEDHVSSVCETMRFVIAVQQRSLDDQRTFFERFLQRGVSGFCDAINASKQARFYRPAGQFARAFVDIEKNAFEMIG